MIELTLTAEQFKLLEGAGVDPTGIVVRSPAGGFVGYLRAPSADDFTPDEIAAAKRALANPGPRYTTQEVLDYLNSLDPK